MPTISIDIPDTHPSIIRPVVLDIINDIKTLSGIAVGTKTFFLGATGKALQPNTPMDGVVGQDISPSDMMLQIEVIEEYSESSALTTAMERRDNNPSFYDAALGVMIKPAYSRADFTLNIKARFPDRMSAVKWRNEFKRHTTQGRRTNLHKVTYSYAIPEEMLIILGAIHRLREKQAGYGHDLTTYVGDHLGYTATTVTNRAGENPLLVIGETQANVMGRFDILVAPEPAEVDRERGTWEITFPYKFSMDIPTIAVMQYPLIIHNQMLSKRWRPSEVPDSLEKSLPHLTLSQYAYQKYRETWPGEKRGLPGISYPFFDDWYSDTRLPFYTEMIRIAITVTPDVLHGVIDLKDLGDFVIDPLLMDFLQQRPSNLALLKKSVVKINLYQNQDLMGDTEIAIDDDLVVTTVEPMNLRATYHVTMSMLTDLTMLTTEVQDELRKHGELAIALLSVLYPGLAAQGLLPTLMSGGSIKKLDFLELANIAKDYYLDNYETAGGNLYTVGIYSIIGRRR